MSVFPFIETDSVVQVNDKFRIRATKSYISKGEADITLVEIEPEAGDGFIDVTGGSYKDWFLDWQYATDGIKTVTVRITTDGAPVTSTLDVVCLTEVDDYLFSTDQELKTHETDILKYVPEGYNTFKYVHRESQTQMLESLYRIGITDTQGNKLTKDAVIDVDEVREWSRFLTLQFIFSDLSTMIGDYFSGKEAEYREWALESRQKAIMKLDLNGDGSVSQGEGVDITWRRLNRV